jgi:hypothetical protein
MQFKEEHAWAHIVLNKGKHYNNMQAFIVEGWWYKQVSILVGHVLLSSYLLASISVYQTQLTYKKTKCISLKSFHILIMWGSRPPSTMGTAKR